MNSNVAVNVFLYDPKTQSVLLQLRDNNPNIANPNVWCFPGGGGEPEDDSVEAAAKRELFEETGYKVLDLQLVGTDTEYDKERYFFFAEYDGVQKIEGHEGQKMEFISLDALPENIWEGHIEWIEKITQSIH